MKCASCQSAIDDKAKICPFCQRYLTWKSPHRISTILSFVLPIFILTFIYSRLGSADYDDYKASFSMTFVSETSNKKEQYRNYEITNTTDIKWKDMVYQFIGYDKNGTVVLALSRTEYSWTIEAHSTAILTVKFESHPDIVKWELIIKGLNSRRLF